MGYYINWHQQYPCQRPSFPIPHLWNLKQMRQVAHPKLASVPCEGECCCLAEISHEPWTKFSFSKRWSETRSCVRKKSGPVEHEDFHDFSIFLHRISRYTVQTYTRSTCMMKRSWSNLFQGWDVFLICGLEVRPFSSSGIVPSDYPAVLGALLPNSLSLGSHLWKWMDWNREILTYGRNETSFAGFFSTPGNLLFWVLTQISGTFSSSVECFQPNFPRSPWCFFFLPKNASYELC